MIYLLIKKHHSLEDKSNFHIKIDNKLYKY